MCIKEAFGRVRRTCCNDETEATARTNCLLVAASSRKM